MLNGDDTGGIMWGFLGYFFGLGFLIFFGRLGVFDTVEAPKSSQENGIRERLEEVVGVEEVTGVVEDVTLGGGNNQAIMVKFSDGRVKFFDCIKSDAVITRGKTNKIIYGGKDSRCIIKVQAD